MNITDAQALIARAIPRGPGVWADFGAGDGTFSQALAYLLEPGSRIYAVDRKRAAMVSLKPVRIEGITLIPVVADFTRALVLPGVAGAGLDGMLFANALHFVSRAADVLRRLAPLLRPGGRLVIVEYDRRGPNHWVPYPIPAPRLAELLASAGFSTPTITATRPSAYGGSLYVAAAERGSAP
ncbi:MAG: class I SAM-dependent methyltransferase [Gemmatimonadales bacterium]